GQGLNALAEEIYHQIDSRLVALACYKGSLKNFFKAIATQLDVPTENEKGSGLSVDVLKDEILMNVGEDTVFVFPEAQRLTTSIRYWLEDCMEQGVTIACFGTHNPNRDIYLHCGVINLGLPEQKTIRQIMRDEAIAVGWEVSDEKLADLEPLAGRNPMLARKVVRNAKHGMVKTPEHTQYVTVMPIVIAALFAFAVVRFVGLGTGNRALYIMGGVSLVAAMGLRQLGNVRGSRKVLGQ
ncbi:MAG: hypothetical protein ACK58N_10265, partial [Synechocystis sp.]